MLSAECRAGKGRVPSRVDTRTAVVLVSGGLDSAVTLAAARRDGFLCHALSFDYGQRHRQELAAAALVAESLGAASHRLLTLDLRAIGGSALTADIAVPKDRPAGGTDIPVTYVPARNLVFLSLAAGLAEVLTAHHVFIGVNAVDYSGYPDCRPEFIDSFERTVNLATRAGVEGARLKVHTPLISLTKAGIVRLGVQLGVDFSLTTSCYDPTPEGAACGHCDSCTLRAQGFLEAGVADPTRYAV
ncbi:7-cyano-7-deazaguanine synthase [Phycisphaerales bacterium]|nr:7-cyano-7-deazaguanine synthase [Phycisphaerales bacterium]